MSTSDVKDFLDESSVVNGFELGEVQVVVTDAGVCRFTSHISEKSTSEYDSKNASSAYSFVSFDSINGVKLNEKVVVSEPKYDDVVIGAIIGFMGVVASIFLGDFLGVIVVSVSLLVLLAVAAIALDRREEKEVGTTARLYVESDLPEDQWKFRSETVTDPAFQEFVKDVSKRIQTH